MIPKIIHYCWFGNNNKPESVKKCIDSWKKFCPDYKIIEWNEKNYDFTKNEYMYEAYKEKRWGFVPEFARLDIIYNNGGIYLDTDVELCKTLDDLLVNEAYMGFEDSSHVNPGLGFGSVKNNGVLLKMMDEIYSNRHFIKDDGSYDTTPSPILNTEFLVKNGLVQNNKKQTVLDMVVYPTEYFCPKNFDTFEINISNNTYSIHHFDMSWVSDVGRYRHSLQLKLNKILPLSLSKIISKTVTVIKYRGFREFFKIIISKVK